MSAYFRNCTLVVVLVAVVSYWVATRDSTAANPAANQVALATAQQPAIQGQIEGLEKASAQLKLLLDNQENLKNAGKRILAVPPELIPVVQKAIRELQADQKRLKGEFEVTLRSLRPAEDGQHPKIAEQVNRIQTAMRKLVRLPEPSPAADIPVQQLLLGLGVDPVLAASQSNWCECLNEVAHARRSDGGFITVDGERFPALAPLPPPPIPGDNRQTLHEVDDPKTPYNDIGFPRWDDPKVQLGYLLFFDVRLSGDNSVACSTCHAPDQGWGLNSDISRGYPGTSHWRNSHTAMNSAYMWKLFSGQVPPRPWNHKGRPPIRACPAMARPT